MSPDLRHARVRLSVLGDEEAQQETVKGLESARGLIRHELGKRLQNLKFAPELVFEIDPSIEYSVRISKQLRDLLPVETPPSAGADTSPPSGEEA
jgi:ribosome-binding factor A